MYLTHPRALEMGKQLRNAVLNNFDRDRSGYDDIDGKSRLAQAHELLNYFILSVRILQKDARMARIRDSVSILNITERG